VSKPEPAFGALRPLNSETAGSRIADRFVTAIALGQFVPGQKLPTVQTLAGLLEVSPTTVREALGRLVALGYVVVRRGRWGGTFVTEQWGPESDAMVRRALEPEWAQLEVTLDFRSLIEQQIARTAALRHTSADARQIKAALLRYEQAGTDRESSRQADLAVHHAIAVATQNAHLVDLSHRVLRDVSLGFEAEPYNVAVRERALQQHPRLAQAVFDRDPERAAHVAADHFSLTETTLRGLHARLGSAINPSTGGHLHAH
jgi:GntR family transcriptional repressor for pyruvate dehydrogenase complex